MTLRDDLRALAEIDTHHGSLRDFKPRSTQTILVEERDAKPLIAAVVWEQVCPIDRTATFKVEYWLADITAEPRALNTALIASMRAIGEEMDKVGATVCWGWIPLKGRHLLSFLDSLEDAGVGRWEDNDNVPGLDDTDIRRANGLGRFFIADLDKAKRFV